MIDDTFARAIASAGCMCSSLGDIIHPEMGSIGHLDRQGGLHPLQGEVVVIQVDATSIGWVLRGIIADMRGDVLDKAKVVSVTFGSRRAEVTLLTSKAAAKKLLAILAKGDIDAETHAQLDLEEWLDSKE